MSHTGKTKQPSGVVDAQRLLDWNRAQPEPRPIVIGREYQVAEACARLNSSPVSAGDDLTASECACGDQYPANSYGAGFMAANNGVCENCDASAPSHGDQVRHMVLAGWKLVPVEPTPEMISAASGAITTPDDLPPAGVGGWSMSDLAFRSRYRAAIAAAPSAGSQEQG